MTKSIKVPSAMKARYEEITKLTDQFSNEKLDNEYKDLARQIVAALSRKKPSPLNNGQAKVWACSAIHAVGMVNFLYDKSTKPYLSNSDLISWFDVG